MRRFVSTTLRATSLGCALLLSTGASAGPADAAEIESVEFSEIVRVGEVRLVLNNVALLRYRVIFRGYVAGLYLGDGVEPAFLLDDVPRRLEIEYFWGIPARKFAEATIDGISANRSSGEAAGLQPQIRSFNALYRDIEPGDRYALTYVPGVGTELAHNGVTLGRVEGADFSSALFSIWFGDSPFDAGLKRRLLTSRPRPPGESGDGTI